MPPVYKIGHGWTRIKTDQNAFADPCSFVFIRGQSSSAARRSICARTREDARQRALTRPVFADQRVNLAAPQGKMGVAQGANAAVVLGYILGVKESLNAASIQNRPRMDTDKHGSKRIG